MDRSVIVQLGICELDYYTSPIGIVSKLTDCEGEAGETQVWLEFALEFEYIDKPTYDELNNHYEHIIAMLISMSSSADNWIIK